MSYILFAWIASIFYGLETIIGKLTSKYSLTNPLLFNFAWSLFVLIFTTPIAVYNGINFPSSWTNLILASLFSALAGIFYVLAVYALDVSVLSPLFNFRTVFSVILGSLFLNEVLSFQQYFWVVLIFIAGFFVSLDEKYSIKNFFKRGVAIALIEMFLLSLMSVFIKNTVANIGYWSSTFWIALISQVFLLPTILFFKNDLLKSKLNQYFGTVLIAIIGTFGTLASIKATSANVSISTVIISLPISMIMAFILSIVKPKLLEKHSLNIYAIRFASAAIMLFGALKLSL